MKPSQYRRLERKALMQREQLKSNIEKAKKIGMRIAQEQNENTLKGLIITMRSLKKQCNLL